MDRVRITVRGVVQGVGFRPFVYRLAHQWHLSGFVLNTPQGATIEVEGEEEKIKGFTRDLKEKTPPGAKVSSLRTTSIPPKGEEGFRIAQSSNNGEPIPSLMPDMATCHECLKELHDPQDRRFRYPFINCVHCGPRFTIVERLPYDRENTTMRVFQMCHECLHEYRNPRSRRFHAQPNACPACGPHVWLASPRGKTLATRDEAIKGAAQALREGKILAMKGLGGFHILCRADQNGPVELLRRRKRRPEKPLAVMFPSLKQLEENCQVSWREREMLLSPQAPIVVLPLRDSSYLSSLISPGLKTVGAFLPYTPLHHLLLREVSVPLVATSGNLSDEPLAITNQEALERLGGIADLFLLHDRPIKRPCDDSVVAFCDERLIVTRRARGWVPLPVEVPVHFESPVLALGGHMKNTVALGIGGKVILSQHMGDLSHRLTQDLLERTIKDMLELFGVEPALVVVDKHPQYYSHRLGYRLFSDRVVKVQHHFAHLAACAAECGLRPKETFVGVALDGTGLGDDGTIWGGEILLASLKEYRRLFHLLPFPLPGGDKVVEEPYRVALSLLKVADCEPPTGWLERMRPQELKVLSTMVDKRINSPLTSSMGRLFDGVASLLGVKDHCSYEAQAAVMLEESSMPQENGCYPYGVDKGVMDWRPMVEALIGDLREGIEVGRIAAKLHNTVVEMLTEAILQVSRMSGANRVVLSGGAFQNRLLLSGLWESLEAKGLVPLFHRQVPTNDGGLSLGQAVIGSLILKGR